MNFELRNITRNHIEEIKTFFTSVFTKEPWNDDWSDKQQLHAYITDLTGNPNSLALGLFKEDEMIGLSMGCIRHWYTGTEYCIDELCIKTEEQGKGIGSQFLQAIENYTKDMGLHQIFLQTDRNVPAYEFYKKNSYSELSNHVSFAKALD